ncbi:hypothetical protein BCR44DRAFT_33470 [Catenaria anguillulae PL171]|uniref:Uncharacterized protein n=1 Tax=Catenaria anguillulae PL171 TaxID=765915 RepID=A0A1Y2H6H2_9FUNG|nr:hypothetical protein BCR44DRAFT_33470 [Catenaria anguillulae PL171]
MDTSTLVPIINLSLIAAILVVWRLWQRSGRLLLAVIFATTIASCLHFALAAATHHGTLSDLGSLIKLIGVWPLGLGSLVAYSLLPAHRRHDYLPVFTQYINAAVLGNIAMMFFLHTGDTLRGQLHRVNCVLLVTWLVQEMRLKKWATVSVNRQGLFLFNASPLAWVLCHAMYRGAMVTLPRFDTTRFLVLEPASLATMVLLGRRAKAQSWEQVTAWFGLADTLVVATIVFASSVWSAFGMVVPALISSEDSEYWLDRMVSGLHLVVGLVAAFHIVCHLRRM